MERKRNEYIGSRGGRIPALELNSESNKIQIGNGKACIRSTTLDLLEHKNRPSYDCQRVSMVVHVSMG